MSLKAAVTLCGLIATATAAVVRGGHSVRFGCGTGRPTEELMQVSRKLQAEESELAARDGGRADGNGAIVVDTYVHVVAKDETVRGGYISASTVAKQMEVLRETYGSTGVSFVHKDTSWTVHPSWSVDNNEEDMKRTLRKGSYRDLNLYYLKELSGPPGTLGYCNFPSTSAKPASRMFYLDGCNVHVGSVPGGPLAGFNLGKTTTHEVGHWFGLMHTFEGDDCHGPGDHVDDTPAQASSSQGCPIGRDSCPDLPGPDPIHNYMDYSSDPCYEEFTPGQISRIRRLWHKYRANR
ncbi:hypothetical protein E4U53_007396 [Claviceps sorghi]|nr:hypothetical protein E4U53_007396 [Claviceps sorghi]